MIELGAAWIPHKDQRCSEAVCVKGDNGLRCPRGHLHYDWLWKSETKSSPKSHMQRLHYAGRALDSEPLNHWEPGTNGRLYLQHMPAAH